MQVTGLDGKLHVLDLRPGKNELRDADLCRSSIQYNCGQLLKKRYPLDRILEEIHLPGTSLYLDFFIPSRKIAFEIHGIQHDKFVPFFHGSRGEYHQSQQRDINKEKWCRINKIDLYTIRSVEELEKLLYG